MLHHHNDAGHDGRQDQGGLIQRLIVFTLPVYAFVNPGHRQHEQEGSEHRKKQTAGIPKSENGSDVFFRPARILDFFQVVIEKGIFELS